MPGKDFSESEDSPALTSTYNFSRAGHELCFRMLRSPDGSALSSGAIGSREAMARVTLQKIGIRCVRSLVPVAGLLAVLSLPTTNGVAETEVASVSAIPDFSAFDRVDPTFQYEGPEWILYA